MRAGRGGAEGRLRLCLLDGFAVSVDGRGVPDAAWARRKARQLLKLLALAPAHRLHRDQALEALWPDLPPAGATRALYPVLFHLRRALEPDLPRGGASRYVRLERDRLVLAAPGGVETDVERFERAAAAALGARGPGGAAAIRAALALGGELLPDDRYEDWAQARRRALQELVLALHAAAGAAPERAAHLFGAAEGAAPGEPYPLHPVGRADRERGLEAVRARLGSAAFAAAWAAGQKMTIEEAVAFALAPDAGARRYAPPGGAAAPPPEHDEPAGAVLSPAGQRWSGSQANGHLGQGEQAGGDHDGCGGR